MNIKSPPRAVLATVVGLLAALPGLAQPRLEIHRPSEATFEFRWPGAASSFLLEAANPLATPTDWQTLFETPVLVNGMFSLTLPAAVDSRFFRLRSTATGVESLSPTNRESGVALARSVIIRFNGPLDLDSVRNGGGIYAEHNGFRLPASVDISGEDGRTVTLSFANDLPAAARIRVTLDGSLLRDENGQGVDVRGSGLPGGIRALEFETIDNRPPDTDGDGLDDPTEAALGTDPALWDSDSDGFGDGPEQEAGTDPLSIDLRPGIRLADAPGNVRDLLASFTAYGPFAVSRDAIAADGMVLNRIAAVLNPQATPTIVNAALDAAGLRIVTRYPGMPFVTLALPPRPGNPYSAAEVESIAQQLVVNSDLTPFVSAHPTFEARPLLAPGPRDSEATVSLRPHDQIRMPAAWNLLADASAPPAIPVRVLVPDFYTSPNRFAQIWVQRFVASPGLFTATREGNHGFAVAGAVAGDYDEVLPTGTYPAQLEDATRRLEILSLPVGNLTWEDAVHAIVNAIIAEQPNIVSTSIGFTAPVPVPLAANRFYTRAERIELAFLWRQRVLASGRQFLHIAAAGNDFARTNLLPAYERLAEFSAPWNLAARRGNLDDMILGATELTVAERNALEDMVGALPTILPGLFEPLENVIIVGSIDADGSRSDFSEPGEDIMAQGSALSLGCTFPFFDQGEACDGTIWDGAAGTSFAAPQVAGVASYLLTRKPGLSPVQLRETLLNTRAGEVLDAYRAVLDLDAGDHALPLRRRLMDVAGGVARDATGVQPDGKFDEKDLAAFVTAFRDGEAAALLDPGAPPDRSRFDLNGDGSTGGAGVASVDLDAADGLGSVSLLMRGGMLEVEETAVTDREACCYFAYSGLYEGSELERGRLLAAECPLPPLLAFRFQDSTGNGLQVVSAKSGSSGYWIRDGANLNSFGRPMWSPDGSELVYWAVGTSGPNTDILVRRIGGVLGETAPFVWLTGGADNDTIPVFFEQRTSNGDYLYFTRVSAGTAQTWVARQPGGGPPRPLTSYGAGQGQYTPFGHGSQQGSVSANNEWAFGFRDGAGGASTVRIIRPDGFERTLTPGYLGTIFGAYWSPAGGSIAYVADGKVLLVSSTTLEIQTLATDSTGGYRLSWSPDGRYVAYQCENPGGGFFDLCAADVQGGAKLWIAQTPGAAESDPAWSPDGKEIAFNRDNDVWVRTIATATERRLTFTPDVEESGIVWRPGSNSAP